MLARRAIIGRCYPKSDVCPASHNKAAKRVQFPYPHLPNGSAGCITPGLVTWDQPRSMAVSICRDSCTLLREARANTSNGLCSPTTSQGGYSHKKLALRARCNLPNIRRVSLGLACQSGPHLARRNHESMRASRQAKPTPRRRSNLPPARRLFRKLHSASGKLSWAVGGGGTIRR